MQKTKIKSTLQIRKKINKKNAQNGLKFTRPFFPSCFRFVLSFFFKGSLFHSLFFESFSLFMFVAAPGVFYLLATEIGVGKPSQASNTYSHLSLFILLSLAPYTGSLATLYSYSFSPLHFIPYLVTFRFFVEESVFVVFVTLTK